jgi:pyridoxal phosphate enzyme (YggS family)
LRIRDDSPRAVTNPLEKNLARVRARIASLARECGREPGSIALVAVTKTVDAATATALARLGALDLGENRADALAKKAAALRAAGVPARWHFVGHVQTNKADVVAEWADVVHSVDSERLIETLDRNAGRVGRSLSVYLQVKLHPEATKSGLAPDDLPAAIAAVRAAPALEWLGLMTMAPLAEDDPARALRLADDVFARLAELGRAHGAPGLSMGMSGDYDVAIRRGSTCVRIGSALFESPSTNGARA